MIGKYQLKVKTVSVLLLIISIISLISLFGVSFHFIFEFFIFTRYKLFEFIINPNSLRYTHFYTSFVTKNHVNPLIVTLGISTRCIIKPQSFTRWFLCFCTIKNKINFLCVTRFLFFS